jgi:hypothetical protein
VQEQQLGQQQMQLLLLRSCMLRTFWRTPHPHVDALWHQVLQQGLLHWEAVVHVDQGWAVQQRVAVMANTNLRQASNNTAAPCSYHCNHDRRAGADG